MVDNNIICPFIIDEYDLTQDEMSKIEIALVLINAELERKKQEDLNFIGKFFYSFYLVPITENTCMIFDTMKLFSERVRLKDIELLINLNPETSLGDPNADKFIEQIKEFSKKVEGITKSKGEKIKVDGLLNQGLTDELGEFINKKYESDEILPNINAIIGKEDVIEISKVFKKLFTLRMGKFLDYHLKAIHSINAALISIYKKYEKIIEEHDVKIENLHNIIDLMNNTKSNQRIEELQKDYENQYSNSIDNKNERINQLDNKIKVLYNSKHRLHSSYSSFLQYLIEIQKEIEQFGFNISENFSINEDAPVKIQLPMYVIEYTKKNSRFHYIAPFHLRKAKKPAQTMEHVKDWRDFEDLLDKNFNKKLINGIQRNELNNILDQFEETKKLFYDGMSLISERKWLESGIYVKVMDFFNEFFNK